MSWSGLRIACWIWLLALSGCGNAGSPGASAQAAIGSDAASDLHAGADAAGDVAADLGAAATSDVLDAMATGTDAGSAQDLESAVDSGPAVDSVDDSASAADAGGDSAGPADIVDADAAADAAAAPTPPPIWDLAAIADPTTAGCTFTNEHAIFKGGASLTGWKLAYTSWESIDGKLQPIVIRGFAVRPAGTAKLPGVILAHGLGGHADEGSAAALAARLGMFVIAYTGPGGGSNADDTSGGLASGFNKGYRMFDVMKDVRGSWFWGHAVAAMRGVTCLQTRADVDGSKLGVTGFSAGGVVSLLLAGHDPRVKAAVPMSGTLAWAKATEAQNAWQHGLLKLAGLSIASPEWLKLQAELIDPTVALSKATAHVLMVDGTTDEFFPLTAFAATWNALPDADKRLSLIGNFDHGCYKVSGVESAAAIEARASLHGDGAQRMWLRHWLGSDANYAYVPQPPQVTAQTVGGVTLVTAVVDPGGTKLQVDEVRAWASGDDCFTFGSTLLDGKGTTWSKLVPLPMAANTVLFVDVQYKTKSLLPEHFTVSSLPKLPPTLVPHVRAMDTCL